MSNQNELLKEKFAELNAKGVFSETAEQRIILLEEYRKIIDEGFKESQLDSFVNIFKALGSKTRLSILKLIMLGVKCSCEIEHLLDLSQSTVSHHLKVLSASKIIQLKRSGKWTLANISTGKELSKEYFISLLKRVLV